jgi:hypothetical protein
MPNVPQFVIRQDALTRIGESELDAFKRRVVDVAAWWLDAPFEESAGNRERMGLLASRRTLCHRDHILVADISQLLVCELGHKIFVDHSLVVDLRLRLQAGDRVFVKSIGGKKGDAGSSRARLFGKTALRFLTSLGKRHLRVFADRYPLSVDALGNDPSFSIFSDADAEGWCCIVVVNAGRSEPRHTKGEFSPWDTVKIAIEPQRRSVLRRRTGPPIKVPAPRFF